MNMRYTVGICLLISGFQCIQAKDPNFSFHNKSKKVVYVQVINGFKGKLVSFMLTDTIAVLPDKFCDLPYKDIKDIDITKDTFVRIYDKDQTQLAGAKFAKNKTIYINWDGKDIYPQRGPLKGLKNKTDKGYSTKNNVKKTDIFEEN